MDWGERGGLKTRLKMDGYKYKAICSLRLRKLCS
jgi:hypothetical protein